MIEHQVQGPRLHQAQSFILACHGDQFDPVDERFRLEPLLLRRADVLRRVLVGAGEEEGLLAALLVMANEDVGLQPDEPAFGVIIGGTPPRFAACDAPAARDLGV